MVITIAANIAETAILTYPACFPDSVVGFIADKQKADVRFIEYLFRHLRRQIQHENVGTGSVQDNINLQTLERLSLSVPELPEQRAIAHILGTLDDKIELNRRRNQNLEAMARALFQDWFVDFGPVRTKMGLPSPAGREAGGEGGLQGKPYLPADLWQLFPDRIDDEGKPEGWEMGCLGDFTDIKNGYAFKSKDWREQGIPVVKIGSVKPLFVDLNQVSFIDQELAEDRAAFRLKVGDMLVGLTGYVGETGRIPPTDICPMLNQRVGKFEPKNKLDSFVFANVRMPEFKIFSESKAHGSAQANVSTSDLLKYPVINPGNSLLKAFGKATDSIFAKLMEHEGEKTVLAALRDTLLPKLISGELRITDAEKFMERVQL